MTATNLDRVNRREFLHYVWASSIALVLAQGAGIAFWFALPRLRQYIAMFVPQELPGLNQAPTVQTINGVSLWLTHTDAGVSFLAGRCTHLHCDVLWFPNDALLACPCHGSQFAPNGAYIAGPAPRNLDRFPFEIRDAKGDLLARSQDGAAVMLPEGAHSLWVNTIRAVKGQSHI